MADRKKLKVSLELDTSAARRSLKSYIDEFSGPSSGGGAAGGASKLAQSLDKAAQSADKTAQSFNMTQSSAMRLTRGFAGIAVGLAASYAASYVDNPNAKAAFGYAGNALSGAAAGFMFGGPIGAAVGGAAGIAKTYLDNEGEKSAMSKDFEQAEAIYAAVRAKNAKFQELSNVKDGADIAGNLAEAKKIIENYTATTADFVQQVRDELKKMNPDKELIAKLRRNIDYNRGEIQRYEGLTKTLEELQNKQTTPRESMTALDSLTKIGGIAATPAAAIAEAAEAVTGSAGGVGFGFSVPTTPTDTSEFSARSEGLVSDFEATMKMANERIEKIDADQLKVLTEIKDALKGQGGTSTWQ